MDAEGRPTALKLTEGQAHDGRSSDDMLSMLGPGQTLLGDRAYDSDERRDCLAKQGAWANVRPMPNRKNVPRLQLILVPLPQPRRTVLQQDQALQSSSHPLRQGPGQLSRKRQTRSRPHLAPIL